MTKISEVENHDAADKSSVDLLDQMSELEDDFDVDLMACGCRLAAGGTNLELSVRDVVRLFDLDQDGIVDLLGALIDEGGIDAQKVFSVAESVSSGKIKEAKLSVGDLHERERLRARKPDIA
ncbi:MAG: hypothetical protein AAF483_09995 [Planctomycetota bacterium]